MRRRKSGSDLYQVDFVAALFGGFVLIWLSGMTSSESSDNNSDITLYAISARLNFADSSWLPVMPTEEASLGCVHPEAILQKVAPNSGLMPCQQDSIFAVHITNPSGGYLYPKVLQENVPHPNSSTSVITWIAAWFSDMTIVLGEQEKNEVAIPLGYAIINVQGTNAYGSGGQAQGGDGAHVLSGIVIGMPHTGRPRFLRIRAFSNGGAVLAIPSNQPSLISASPNNDSPTLLTSYLFPVTGSQVVLGKQPPVSLTVEVKELGGACWGITLTNQTVLSDDQELSSTCD
jgi:hypothetical protein